MLVAVTSYLQLITQNALLVYAPPRPAAGMVEITLMYRNKQFCKTAPGRFLYSGKWQVVVIVMKCNVL